MRAVLLQREGNQINPGKEVELFPVTNMYADSEDLEFAPSYTYDVAGNGQRFLVLWRPPDMPFPALNVLTKWESVLTAASPGTAP